jgi:hemolysin activation/secretion protein
VNDRIANRRTEAAALLATLVAVGCAATGHAQQAPSAATRAAEPGRIEQRIERLAVPTAPRPEIAPVAPAPQLQITGKPGTFVLSGVDIVGSTVYDAAELAKLYEPLLARRISLVEIEELLAAITRKYHADGYVLSRAVAPPQQVALGILKIQVIEGYVARVTFDGAKPGGQALLDAYARTIAAERPLTLAVLERETLLMGDLPGVTARPAILPLDESKGAYELRVSLAHDKIAGTAELDNRGTDSTGPLQSYGVADLNSVLGRLESTRLTFFTVPNQPREILYGELRHDEPVGTDGARLAFSVSRSWVDAGDDLRLLDENSRSLRVAAELRYPLVRRRKQSLYLMGQAYWSDNFEDVLGSKAFADRVRAVGASARLNVSDDFGGNSVVGAGLVAGLPVLDGSRRGDKLLSRPRGTGDFIKLTFDAARQQRIDGPWSAYVTAAGQTSGAVLLSSEEFGVGGARFGRGYDPSEITGSRGVAGAVELRFDDRIGTEGIVIGYQLYGFADYGAVWNDPPEGGTDRDTLASAGLGVRTSWRGQLFGEAELAFPLTRGVATNGGSTDGPRVFFRLTATF